MTIDENANEHSAILPKLDLPSFLPLSQINERQKCAKCGRRRMYFCYDCRIYVGEIASLVPRIKLPVKIDICKHQRELNGKSTAIHAVLLAPEDTKVFDKFSDVPDYSNSPGTAVLCPSKQSTPIDQFVASNGPIKRLIVLDSTWNTLGTLKSLSQLTKLPWVHLSSYRTEYWRPQKGLSAEHLATIEAIYFACRECADAERRWRMQAENSNSQKPIVEEQHLDGLLFWFYFFRQKVPASKFAQK